MENRKQKLERIACVLLGIVTIVFLIMLGKGAISGNKEESGPQNSENISTSQDFSFKSTASMSDEEKESLMRHLAEDEEKIYESAALPKPEILQYMNRCVSVSFPSGSVLSLGVDTDDQNAIYLDPHYDCIDDEIILNSEITKFGFYITSSLPLDFEYSTSALLSYNDPKAPTFTVITDRTYDTLLPAAYHDSTEFGIKWTDANNITGSMGKQHILNIRVVRFPDGYLMGCADLIIGWDDVNSKYYIEDLIYSDVSNTNVLSPSERESLVDQAFDFLSSGTIGQSFILDNRTFESIRNKTVVQKIKAPYFSKLFDSKGNVISAGKYSGADIYAVSLSYPSYGVMTVYFAPKDQIGGLRSSVPGTENLIPFGYDAIHPETKDTLFVPEWQLEDFYK